MSDSGVAFPTILASTVHDMKNSIGMLMRALEQLVSKVPEGVRDELREVSVVQYEAARVNNALIQLLALYKLDQSQLPLNINYHPILDFFEELQSHHAELLEYHHMTLDIDCDPDLQWFFDYDLLLSAFGNVLTNTIRYSQSKILLKAEQVGCSLVLTVADNGKGFPPLMIEKQQDFLLGVNYSSGSTGLGLFFCSQIAALHTRNETKGDIRLQNDGILSGGHFIMTLP